MLHKINLENNNVGLHFISPNLQTLKNIQGRFLLSYDDSPKVRELYKDFYIVETVRLNGINNRAGINRENKYFKELLIANYDITKLHNDR